MVGAEGIAWFLIGEGTITLNIYKRNNTRLEFMIYPFIVIINSEKELLEEVKKTLDTKDIHSNIFKASRKSSKLSKHDWFRLEIKNYPNTQKFLEFILPYLFGKKKIAAELVLEVCKKYKRKGIDKYHYNLERERLRFLEIMKYKQKLMQLTNRSFAKYTYEYFKNLWGL